MGISQIDSKAGCKLRNLGFKYQREKSKKYHGKSDKIYCTKVSNTFPKMLSGSFLREIRRDGTRYKEMTYKENKSMVKRNEYQRKI